MKSFQWPYAVMLLLLLSPNPARAGEDEQTAIKDQAALMQMEIEDLRNIKVDTIFSASKYEQKVTEAPSSVSIITAEEIKKYGYRTLADILRSVRGFYVTYDRNYSYVGVRGFNRPGESNTRVLLLIDGHKTNDNIYDAALFGTDFPLDIDLINRIEVIRGPSSSIYGTNAFFAVINVITRKGRDLSGGEVSGAVGSLDTYNGRLSAGAHFTGGPEALISGSLMDSKGNHRLYYREFDSPATNNGIAENCDSDSNYNLFSKASFKDFTLEGVFGSRTKHVPTAPYGNVFNDDRNRTIDELGYLDLKYEHKLGDRSGILARLNYNHYNFDGNYMFDNPPVVAYRVLAVGDWWGGEMQLTTTAITNNKIIGGLEYEDNIKQDQKSYADVPSSFVFEDKRRSERWAAYLQDELLVSKNVSFNAGVRYDHYSTFGGSTNPRISLLYNPLDKTTLKFLYGTAFRVPNVYELYYNDGGYSTKANPDLKPEKITTYEIVLEQYLGETLRVSAAGFRYETKDLIKFEKDPTDNLLVLRNTEEVSANGLELELEKTSANGVAGRISYTYQKVINDDTHEWSVNSPRQLAKFNLTAPIVQDALLVGLEEQYTGKRKTVAGNNDGGFVITNLTLFSRKLIKGVEMSASIYNLLDKTYGDPGNAGHAQDILEQDGRNYRFKATYNF